MFSAIRCEFMDEEERSVGSGYMMAPPRKGETVWLQSRAGHPGPRLWAFEVEDVAYWVPDLTRGYEGMGCESCAVYVKTVEG